MVCLRLYNVYTVHVCFVYKLLTQKPLEWVCFTGKRNEKNILLWITKEYTFVHKTCIQSVHKVLVVHKVPNTFIHCWKVLKREKNSLKNPLIVWKLFFYSYSHCIVMYKRTCVYIFHRRANTIFWKCFKQLSLCWNLFSTLKVRF